MRPVGGDEVIALTALLVAYLAALALYVWTDSDFWQDVSISVGAALVGALLLASASIVMESRKDCIITVSGSKVTMVGDCQ